MTALKVVVGQYGASHNREVCVGAQKIVGELPDKIKQFHKCIMIDGHTDMPTVQYDAVFVVIYIRRILESPVLTGNPHRYDSVILPCGVIHISGIAFIFYAKLALWI